MSAATTGITSYLKRNRYPSTCWICSAGLNPKAGFMAGDPPRLYCEACAEIHVNRATAWEEWTGCTLYPFQRTAVAWLGYRDAAILGDEQGVGKSFEAYASIPIGAPVLIVCPSIAKGVWQRHGVGDYMLGIPSCRPGHKASILTGRGSFRWPDRNETTIQNYEILPDSLTTPTKARKSWGSPPGDLYVVYDESHYVKNPKSQRGAKCMGLAALVTEVGGTVWGLTGTPLKTTPADLYGMATVLGLADQLPPWPDYARLMGGVKNGNGWEWARAPSPLIVPWLQKIMLRREKADVLDDLPPITEEVIPVSIDDATRESLDEACRLLRDAGIDLVDAKREALAENQHIATARKCLAAAKVPVLLDVVREHRRQSGRPLIVLSAHRGPVEALSRLNGWAAIVGGGGEDHRSDVEREFQAGNLQGVAISIRAGGTAITLTAADRTIAVDLEWSPSDNEQAWARNHRIGQRYPVTRTKLIADHPLDEALWRVLERRERTIDRSVRAARSFV